MFKTELQNNHRTAYIRESDVSFSALGMWRDTAQETVPERAWAMQRSQEVYAQAEEDTGVSLFQLRSWAGWVWRVLELSSADADRFLENLMLG